VPPNAVARVSSYDFTVSVGLMPIGLAAAGPISDALGLHQTLRAMSAVGVAAALLWLMVPAVRRVERPATAPAPEPGLEPSAPALAPPGPEGAYSNPTWRRIETESE
jgi:hypothetical protein